MQTRTAKGAQYLLVNLFVFALAGVLYLCSSRIGLFEPVRRALGDMAITDLSYSNRGAAANEIPDLFPQNIILVNVAHRSRYEIAQMLEWVEVREPRVVGFDVMFSSGTDSGSNYLKAAFARYSNCVVSTRGGFESSERGLHMEPGLLQEDSGYANLAGIDKEHQTVRYFYPYYNGRAAFSTAILKKYDARLAMELDSSSNQPREIHYCGGDIFHRIDYRAVQKKLFEPPQLKGKIVLFGYLGAETDTADSNQHRYTIDEDRLYTPLNDRLSGRSYPDMYGVLVHANILRMMLDQDYIKVVPGWGIWLTAFVISLLLVPVISRWFYTKGVWFHLMSRVLQLVVIAAIIAGSLLLYNFAHIKLEPLLPAFIVLLLVDFVLFYHLLLPLPREE